MTVASDLAEFLARTDHRDLPSKTTESAAMLIASTFASAVLGKDTRSSGPVLGVHVAPFTGQ
jgi:hypothetical protein